MTLSTDLKILASRRRRDVQLDWTLHLWDAKDGTELRSIRLPLGGYNGFNGTVVFSPDGRTLAAGSHFGSGVALWEATGKELGVCHGKGFRHSHLAFSPDGKLLAAAGSAGEMDLWRVASLNADF